MAAFAAAESVVGGRNHLWDLTVIDGTPGELTSWIPWAVSAALAKTRSGEPSLVVPWDFVLSSRWEEKRAKTFQKPGFGWTKNVESLLYSLLQVGGNKFIQFPELEQSFR